MVKPSPAKQPSASKAAKGAAAAVVYATREAAAANAKARLAGAKLPLVLDGREWALCGREAERQTRQGGREQTYRLTG